MTERTDEQRAALLLALQRGLPLVEHPFQHIGERFGWDEQEVLEYVSGLLKKGSARRFGGVFDSRSLGYDSTLCGAGVPADKIDEMADLLYPHPGVTHCYEREGAINLWFTMTAPADELSAEIATVSRMMAPCELLNLPALRRFKIDVVFDTRADDVARDRVIASPVTPSLDWGISFSEEEKDVVRRLQGSVPLVVDPYAAVARGTGLSESALLELLQEWKRKGTLRRVAIILRHRRIGFSANGMCVWKVDDADIEDAGRRLASCPEVTHCYERPLYHAFPFNLFAMIHGGTRQEIDAIQRRLSTEAGLKEGQILVSVKEFKKTSPVFFAVANEGPFEDKEK